MDPAYFFKLSSLLVFSLFLQNPIREVIAGYSTDANVYVCLYLL